jgi:hypothetical protein
MMKRRGKPLIPNIEGHVEAGFEPVRDAFAENFARRRELGAGGPPPWRDGP